MHIIVLHLCLHLHQRHVIMLTMLTMDTMQAAHIA
jgi:hypothetical protein